MADLAQLARKWNRHADEITLIAPCRSERLEADAMRRCAAELLVALSDAALSHAAGQEVDTVYSLLLRASLLAREAGAESMEDEILEVMDSLWPAMSDDERKQARDYTAAGARSEGEG